MNGFRTMDMTSAVVTTIDLGPWQPSLNLIQGWLLTCGPQWRPARRFKMIPPHSTQS